MHSHGSLEDFFLYANQSRVGLDSLIPTFYVKMTRPKTLIQFNERNPSSVQAKTDN